MIYLRTSLMSITRRGESSTITNEFLLKWINERKKKKKKRVEILIHKKLHILLDSLI